MPSLMRFVTVLALLGAVGFASVFALATMVRPNTREITVNVSPQRLKPQPAAAAAAANPQTAGAESGGGASSTR